MSHCSNCGEDLGEPETGWRDILITLVAVYMGVLTGFLILMWVMH